jgi:phosphoribosyl 1,2-cyclic phosphodiesterase
LRVAILGSGSSGNVAFVESSATIAARAGVRPTRVLVDAGLSAAMTERRLATLSGAPALEDIDAVLITHEHRDHAGSAAELKRPLWAPAATARSRSLEAARVLAGRGFDIGALRITPVLLPHDADETVGYVLFDGEHRVGILTDCGAPQPDVAAAYAGCDLLVLEANHDPLLLMDGPYPPSLPRRVRGPRGHMSNTQSAELLRLILSLGPPPQVFVAAHVSQKNNHPHLVERALRPLLPTTTEFLIAAPAGLPELVLTRVRPRKAEQLTLALSSGSGAL